jgi:nitrogen fixation NifU-like protein
VSFAADPALRRELIRELAGSRVGYGLDSATVEPNEVAVDGHRRSASCGDEMAVRLIVSRPDPASASRIVRLLWQGRGCEISRAAASALASVAEGLDVSEFATLFADYEASVLARDDAPTAVQEGRLGDAIAFFGVGRLPLRAGCSTLAWRAAMDALGGARG